MAKKAEQKVEVQVVPQGANTVVSKETFRGLTPEEIQDYIDIATEALVEILNQRGMTAEQFREHRKGIVIEEQEFIESERRKLAEAEAPASTEDPRETASLAGNRNVEATAPRTPINTPPDDHLATPFNESEKRAY